jgi:hypothetical protein
MSAPQNHPHHEPSMENPDAVEEVVHSMPIVLPVVGAVLMFLLAFIAITVA